MKGPRRARAVLSRDHLIRALADPAFYEQVPEFGWLRGPAEAARAAYLDSGKARDCKRCPGDFAHLMPVVDALFRGLRDLHDRDPALLAPLKRYLGTKTGIEYHTVVVYYRRSRSEKHPQKLTF